MILKGPESVKKRRSALRVSHSVLLKRSQLHHATLKQSRLQEHSPCPLPSTGAWQLLAPLLTSNTWPPSKHAAMTTRAWEPPLVGLTNISGSKISITLLLLLATTKRLFQ